MSYYGRNDQGVTANSTTTAESSNGAPIGMYAYVACGSSGTANVTHATNAHFGNTSAGSRASVDVNLFANVTMSAFVQGAAVGIFGVTATEQSNNVVNKSPEHPAHAGWNLRTAGSGPIINVAFTGTATGYSNTDVGTVAAVAPGTNATFTISTNSTGGALVLKLTNQGNGFSVVNATPNVSIANSTGGATLGTGATFTAIAGGRAGRVHYETIVAMGSLGAQSAPYGTPALVASNTADNTLFPGT